MDAILSKLKKVNDERKEILSLCKKKEEITKFVDLGRDMFKDKPIILNKYFRNESGQPCYYANLLFFKNIEGITLDQIHNVLKADFKEPISLAGYKYDKEHYRFYTQYMQDEYEEDLFKVKSREEEDAEKEAERCTRIEPLDFKALESLYSFIYKAIKQRYVILFNLEDIPAMLNNALDCYFKGVNCNVSNNNMYARIEEIRALFENSEVIEWLKTGVNDLSCLVIDTKAHVVTHKIMNYKDYFDEEEWKWYQLPVSEPFKEVVDTKIDLSKDYIETYQKVLRTLTGITDDSLKDTCYEIIHNAEDLWEEDILANDIVECDPYYENVDDDEDYLINNEIFD